MSLKSINPYDNKLIREFEEFTEEKTENVLKECAAGFDTWRQTAFEERNKMMRNAAEVLRSKTREYAVAITSEMGKTIRESEAEIQKCAWVCDYYAENAAAFLQDDIIVTDAGKSFVRYEPLGTILGIMPWNFPFWQAFRFIVPALMAGNTILLKHSSNVQICAEKIEEVFAQSGFPAPVFRNLVLGSSRIGRIIENDTIKAVSLTGSEAAGQKVAEAAGRALKKCVLELGGSNAFIVLGDADLEKAVGTAIKSRFQNAGQSCIAAKRFIIDRKISDRFTEMFTLAAGRLKTGDPMKDDTDMGPLSSPQQAEIVTDQIERSVAMGAVVITGGKRENAFITPAVITSVKPGMPLFDEEVFGPVAPITVAEDLDHAIELAGNTRFGLGVTLFTANTARAEELASRFHDGAVFINGMVKSDPRLPFGGTRRSGYGRELSIHGIKEFINVKTVWSAK